jgi:CheY-like chemotaxis protein
VHIRDSGQGIEPGLLPRIFDLFTQGERSPDRSQGGLGIGLALVNSLVALHGGDITAKSEGNNLGATFTVRLSLIEPPVSGSMPGAASGAKPRSSSLDVVVVDDNVDAAVTLQILMQALGHQVRVFHRAQDALDAIVQRPPDVAFLDIGLPDMTGYELAREIRARLGDAAVLLAALSGYGQPQDFAASRAAGLDHHLVKPIDHTRLLDVLERVGKVA